MSGANPRWVRGTVSPMDALCFRCPLPDCIPDSPRCPRNANAAEAKREAKAEAQRRYRAAKREAAA